jgi:uncharacterized RDD family membrane protein YckC
MRKRQFRWFSPTLGARFAGAVVDGVVNVVVVGAAGDLLVINRDALNFDPSQAVVDVGKMVLRVCSRWGAAVMAIQAILITRRGQSIGKIVVRTRIVDLNGKPVGFVRGVLLRAWVFVPIGLLLPDGVASMVSLADALFIFRKDRRCLHDLVAGTRVIQLLR